MFLIFIFFFCDDIGEFTCQEIGVFPNPDTTDCASFIVCDIYSRAQVTNCPEGSHYWPLNKGCFSSYDCATDSTPNNDNVNPCTGFSNYVIIPDKSSGDCSSYITCQTQNVYVGNAYLPITHGIRYECPSGYTYKPNSGCIINYECSNYQCNAKGIFQNVNDCSSFIVCDESSNYYGGSFLYAYEVKCPGDTQFSPFSGKCVSYYTCGGSDPYNGIDPCSNYNWANPKVPNPLDNDCTSYLECQARDPFYNTFEVALKVDCPSDTFFSPVLGKCYYNYQCNQACSKDPCGNGAGRFVDYKSDSCQGFIECRDDGTNSLSYEPSYEKRYCPPGARFSPEKSACDRNYVCPPFPVDYCYASIPTTAPPKPVQTTTSAG